MPLVTRQSLKNFFKNGAKPDEKDFADLLDSLVHQNDPIDALIQRASPQEIEEGVDNNKVVTPFALLQGLAGLARLSRFTELASEIQELINTSIANLVGAAPQTLDTLEEIANAIQIGELDVNYLFSEIGNKLSVSDFQSKFEGETVFGKSMIDWDNVINRPPDIGQPVNGLVTPYQPVVSFSGNTAGVSYASNGQKGSYILTGSRLCTFELRVNFTHTYTGSGLRVSLPFLPEMTGTMFSVVISGVNLAAVQGAGQVPHFVGYANSSGYITFLTSLNDSYGSGYSLGGWNLDSSVIIEVSGTYVID